MSDVFIPLVLAFAGLLAAFFAYRGIRRGGARFYTLEREAMLRRATFSLIGSVVLFLAAIGLLIYERQQTVADGAAAAGDTVEGATVTPTQVIDIFPPTETPTSTPDVNQPTVTPTPPICRAVVDGTFGNGLTLRDAPGGTELDVLPDGSILTMLPDEPVFANDITWRKVRAIGGVEGWVAQQFIRLGAGCE